MDTHAERGHGGDWCAAAPRHRESIFSSWGQRSGWPGQFPHWPRCNIAPWPRGKLARPAIALPTGTTRIHQAQKTSGRQLDAAPHLQTALLRILPARIVGATMLAPAGEITDSPPRGPAIFSACRDGRLHVLEETSLAWPALRSNFPQRQVAT